MGAAASAGENRRLISVWRIQRLVSRFLGVLASIFVFFQLYIGPPLVIAYIIAQTFTQHYDLLTVAVNLLIVILVILQTLYCIRVFRRTYGQYLASPNASAGLVPLSSGMNVAFDQMWVDVVTKLRIDNIPIKLWYRPYKSEINASAIMLEDQAHLLISLGLLRSMNRSPEIARAVLFHEGAHLAQKDSRLWLKAAAFADVIRRITLPIAIGIGAIRLILAILGLFFLFMHEPMLQSARAQHPDSDQVQDLEDERDELLFMLTGQVFLAFFGPAFVLLLGASVASVRRKSEFNADLAAVAFCGQTGITVLLESARRQEKRRLFDYFGTHPSAKRRLRAIQKPGKLLLIKIGYIALALALGFAVNHWVDDTLLFDGLVLLLCFAILLY
jgi:Zn-dependent protease with chaperone function